MIKKELSEQEIKRKEYQKEYHKTYKKKLCYDYPKSKVCKNKRNIRNKNKLKSDPIYSLKHKIRNYLNSSLKKNHKHNKLEVILCCSISEFKTHLESKFESWMNWDNKGNWNGIPKEINVAWDLDHIIPLSSAITEEEIIKLNHYTNIQPLCSYTNRFIKK